MATGFSRRVDELGRVVLPVEIRRALGIEERDLVSVELSGKGIMLKKCQPSCVFCNSLANVITYKGKQVCRACVEKLAEEVVTTHPQSLASNSNGGLAHG